MSLMGDTLNRTGYYPECFTFSAGDGEEFYKITKNWRKYEAVFKEFSNEFTARDDESAKKYIKFCYKNPSEWTIFEKIVSYREVE